MTQMRVCLIAIGGLSMVLLGAPAASSASLVSAEETGIAVSDSPPEEPTGPINLRLVDSSNESWGKGPGRAAKFSGLGVDAKVAPRTRLEFTVNDETKLTLGKGGRPRLGLAVKLN